MASISDDARFGVSGSNLGSLFQGVLIKGRASPDARLLDKQDWDGRTLILGGERGALRRRERSIERGAEHWRERGSGELLYMV